MQYRGRASFLSRNTAYVLIFCWLLCSQRASAQGQFTVVAKTGDAAPGLNDTFGELAGPLINNSGEVVFSEKGLTFDVSAWAPMGVYVGTPGHLQLITKVGDSAPGSGPGVSLTS